MNKAISLITTLKSCSRQLLNVVIKLNTTHKHQFDTPQYFTIFFVHT